MAANEWKEDMSLKEKLLDYVRQGIQWKEMLDYLRRDFSFYSWSIATLNRILRYFEIYYTDNNVTVDKLNAVIMPSVLRLDKGTETRIMLTMHAFLHSDHKDMDPEDTVIYGPSTSNQVSMTTQGHCDVHAYSAMQNIKLGYSNYYPHPPLEEPLSHVGTPLEFLQIFM